MASGVATAADSWPNDPVIFGCWIRCLSARLPTSPDFLSLPAAGFYL